MSESAYLVGWWLALAGLAVLLAHAARTQPPWTVVRRILALACALGALLGTPFALFLVFLWQTQDPSPATTLGSYAAPVAAVAFWLSVLPVSLRAGGRSLRGPLRLMWASLVLQGIAIIPKAVTNT